MGLVSDAGNMSSNGLLRRVTQPSTLRQSWIRLNSLFLVELSWSVLRQFEASLAQNTAGRRRADCGAAARVAISGHHDLGNYPMVLRNRHLQQTTSILRVLFFLGCRMQPVAFHRMAGPGTEGGDGSALLDHQHAVTCSSRTGEWSSTSI